MGTNAERKRLDESGTAGNSWKKWGPYLSERQWGTVREDYSDSGNAWDYFTHDQARSRAYHWGEDGIAGIADETLALCFSVALWNGADPIIKERLFGLANSEGNHGEDVKEYYYYLDSTPTHSYMKYLYKYPQRAYPYDLIVKTNRERRKEQPEYELIDTGVFDGNEYFDVFIEYGKAAPNDILIRITVHNRGPAPAALHLLPTVWFRNTWFRSPGEKRPSLVRSASAPEGNGIEAEHPVLGHMFLYLTDGGELLFTENETNNERIFSKPNEHPYVKDGINNFLIAGKKESVNPRQAGTKAACCYTLVVPPGGSSVTKLRLSDVAPEKMNKPLGDDFDSIFTLRETEANEFYSSIMPSNLSPDATAVYRQALAGMLWSKQYYSYDVGQWLKEHGVDVFAGSDKPIRNRDWHHMVNEDIISMPDKWEYPWYAAWDLAFHTLAFSQVDAAFAKEQLELTLSERYLHPNGQIPAYEWNFSDVNPPVHAWAALFIYRTEVALDGQGDLDFLERVFAKLLLNFTWWVNRKDRHGKNVFEGGFLGLDNIGVFDRSAPLPTGGYLEQADGTAWMAFYAQCMLEISVALSAKNPDYEDMCIKFADHFLLIAAGMNRQGERGMWDEEDGFYYDVLCLPNGSATRLKVRSLVGLLPICATASLSASGRERLPRVAEAVQERLKSSPTLAASIHPIDLKHRGVNDRSLMALVDERRLRRILSRMLDEEEFLSPHGIRSLSRYHKEHPYVFRVGDADHIVDYQAAESNTGTFGGNSNWRGPIWMPTNVLLIRALLQFYLYYGDSFLIEYPTRSGKQINLFEVAHDLSNRLSSLFLLNSEQRRPVFGTDEKFQTDPHFRDYPLFYEYFDGDTGRGVGASHQTGWTGVVARLMELFSKLDAKQFLEVGLKG